MKYDAFSQCHPAVNFLFFVGAIGFGVVFQHPAYLLVGVAAGAIYYLLLCGKKGLRMLLGMLPLLLIITGINPLFNTQGQRILFHVFGRPYTLEALLYGAAVAAIFLAMALWFGCYNAVMTSDKFTSLFGSLIPSLSLLLVMVLRMVPNLIRKARQLVGARSAVGKGGAENAGKKEKLRNSMTVLGALVSWALEGSVVTGDSMRARGYGTAKRSSFQIYRMTFRDWALLFAMLLCAVLVILAAFRGQMEAVFTPKVETAVLSWGIFPYAAYLLIPTALHVKEAIQWHISRSRI